MQSAYTNDNHANCSCVLQNASFLDEHAVATCHNGDASEDLITVLRLNTRIGWLHFHKLRISTSCDQTVVCTLYMQCFENVVIRYRALQSPSAGRVRTERDPLRRRGFRGTGRRWAARHWEQHGARSPESSPSRSSPAWSASPAAHTRSRQPKQNYMQGKSVSSLRSSASELLWSLRRMRCGRTALDRRASWQCVFPLPTTATSGLRFQQRIPTLAEDWSCQQCAGIYL